MTERKPQGLSFISWIDQQILDAEERGVFDNLPGAGNPLDLGRDGDPDYGQAWMRDYARREGVRPDEFLPTPLRLRKEIEQLAQTAGDLPSEREVREVVGDLNRRILEWRRLPVGPPVVVRLVDKDEMIARWRSAQAAAHSPSAPKPAEPAPPARAPEAPRSPWRRRLVSRRGRGSRR